MVQFYSILTVQICLSVTSQTHLIQGWRKTTFDSLKHYLLGWRDPSKTAIQSRTKPGTSPGFWTFSFVVQYIYKKKTGSVRQKLWARLQIHISHAINRLKARSQNTRCVPLLREEMKAFVTAAFLRDDLVYEKQNKRTIVQSEMSMNLEIFQVQNKLSSMDNHLQNELSQKIFQNHISIKCTYKGANLVQLLYRLPL